MAGKAGDEPSWPAKVLAQRDRRAAGSSGRQTAIPVVHPCDAGIRAAIDTGDLGGENVYEKWA